MYKVIEKEILHENLVKMEIEAPLVAKSAKPGQFIILRVDEKGERIPLTIADFDRKKGTVTIIFLEVGKTTKKLGTLEVGDCIESFTGPLGEPSDIRKYGTTICVGGGVGIACLYPIARALKEKGNRVISILGARTKSLLIMEKEIGKYSDELIVVTDDGSKGRKGFVSDALKELIDKGVKVDLVMAIGPVIMMKVISDLTKPYGIKTLVSLNPIMVDGTGMCGSCRVTVNGEIKFACVDGPEFDGHGVDFDNLMLRNNRFREEEGIALKRYMEEQWQCIGMGKKHGDKA
ncbi:MAG: sulfide/dihydroorotate dehydrogenase-like FAD/NAD-binding protein [Thermoplasmata archaeon]|nr:sulfide/dihydroorotate dehydrogenase-like FAD/NAD-binding protein [Thermoplasmata archaeon]RLF27821.1 MAG: sulfide/dihydroorotate dehydrogenase-like FAD/NAD-binding protein [Thermoplasmata archaeon]HHH80071.1 sulfide/dihydroorotate dehydrogenase-like FAD/NAD-binding protein [Thermoplasmatales archaeon]